ncbi:extracellular solute-binding protein [Kineococcus sp. G2]|uniref:extracellular solute-binding protein n=1 Tax=Kineococcus sp. G2 TaxID=3127484 RepID=UPI00301C0EF4
MAVTGVLASCGSSGSGSDGETELTVWMLTLEPTQKEAVETVVEGFEEANPGVNVEVEERATDAHKEALRQVAGTESGPDIYWYWMGPGLGGELIDAGLSMDLTEAYEQRGWTDRFSEAALSSVTRYGGYHGVPWTVQGEGIFYNKELFEQAGITSEPTTYEELVAAADKLVAAGITPIEFGGTVNWHVMRLLDSLIETKCGAETADALNTGEASWADQPCVTEAFTELKTWGEKYINEGFMGISNDDSSQLFYSGDAAMALEGSWFDANVVENGMDPANVGIFPFPTGTNRIYGFTEGFYVNTATEQPELALDFLDYATSAEVQEEVVGAFSPMSVNTEVAPATDNPLHELWPPIFESAEGLYMNNDQNLDLAATTEYWRIQNSVLTGDIAPEDAGEQFQQFLDANE